jgi:hypothetical protein
MPDKSLYENRIELVDMLLTKIPNIETIVEELHFDVDPDNSNTTVLVEGIKAVTDLLPDGGALTSIAKEATLGTPTDTDLATDIANVQSVVDAITLKTVNIPTDPATETTLAEIEGMLDVIDTETDKIASIKSKTDNLPADTAAVLNSIIGYIDTEISAIKTKTDNLPTNTATELTSILEEATEGVDHFHNKERWYGKKTGNNETNAIDNILTPFRVTSGTGGYGTGVCVLGTADVPVTGKTKFDLHRLLCTNFQKQELAKIRLAWGSTTEADAITAGDYSTVMVNPQSLARETELDIRMPQLANGTKVWVNFWSVTNAQWVDFFIGVHGY